MDISQRQPAVLTAQKEWQSFLCNSEKHFLVYIGMLGKVSLQSWDFFITRSRLFVSHFVCQLGPLIAHKIIIRDAFALVKWIPSFPSNPQKDHKTRILLLTPTMQAAYPQISPLILMHFALTQRIKRNPPGSHTLGHHPRAIQSQLIISDPFRQHHWNLHGRAAGSSHLKPDKLWQFYHSVGDPGRQQAPLDDRSADGSLQHSQQGIPLLLPLPIFSCCFCMAQIYQLWCFTELSTHAPITYQSTESVL